MKILLITLLMSSCAAQRIVDVNGKQTFVAKCYNGITRCYSQMSSACNGSFDIIDQATSWTYNQKNFEVIFQCRKK